MKKNILILTLVFFSVVISWSVPFGGFGIPVASGLPEGRKPGGTLPGGTPPNSIIQGDGGKRFYFDIVIDGTLWYKDTYRDSSDSYSFSRSYIYGDFTFSIPIPFGFTVLNKLVIEPTRFNVGTRGFYFQMAGLGYSGRKVNVLVYPFSVGLTDYFYNIGISFVDLKVAFKLAKAFNLQITARPICFSKPESSSHNDSYSSYYGYGYYDSYPTKKDEGMEYVPQFSFGFAFPIRF